MSQFSPVCAGENIFAKRGILNGKHLKENTMNQQIILDLERELDELLAEKERLANQPISDDTMLRTFLVDNQLNELGEYIQSLVDNQK